MSLTQDALSPDIFRLWAGIATVAGALERRVWLRNEAGNVYPNLYMLLVGNPGVGKRVIDTVRDLWIDAREPGTKIAAFSVAPDSMTKASLIDTLKKARKTILPPVGQAIEYHSLLVAAEEFSVLLPSYDMEYIGTLNAIWNNKAVHQEVRRTGPAQSVDIERPTLNLLGGAQPAWLGSIFPEDAWNTGIGRRIIMIYAATAPWKDIWAERADKTPIRDSLVKRLGLLSKAYGQLHIERAAVEALSEWDRGGRRPEPTHAKLTHYLTSRYFQLMKLCIVSAASRGELYPGFAEKPAIRVEDVKRAMEWMFSAEAVMPDIFRAMLGKSDKDVIDEMHLFVRAWMIREKNKAMPGAMIRQFLLDRVPHDKVESLLEIADKSNIVVRDAGSDGWKAKARYDRPGGGA